ncbi:MAG: aldehyde dehydrogenase family protein [Candidatus Omnitrophica bacterium]|nr:aldehyde dehydrogenase family protein [Candidatus Omnitrophota bacterium]MCM8801197.1 aldehyde dehydrogenase family protein [Candidatus Omnitrophota bacterium]
MVKEYPYYIGGEFRKSNEEIAKLNPNNEEVFAKLFETKKEDLDFCLKRTRESQELWKNLSFKERAKVLREIHRILLDNLRLLAELETEEIGKPLKESLFVDIPLGADCFNYYASFLESLEEELSESEAGIDLIKYEPLGVIAVYLPYNVPLMIFGFSCASALAAGNSLIIKPSEYGSLSLLELATYIDKLDIPKGLINIVTGKGDTLGRSLAQSDVDMISFTGSRETLKKIFQESINSPKKIICELGGCNLCVVFSDADKRRVLENILGSSFIKSGQMCIGTSLILIEEEIYEDLVKDLVDKTKRIKMGDPLDPQTQMGPLPTRGHLENIHKQVKDLQAKGAKILCGGEPLSKKGYFYPPTILELKEIIYEEFFAPVVLVKSFKRQDIEKIIKENPTGLVLQIWTNDIFKAKELANMSGYGTVWVNTFAQMSPEIPFGGNKLSGWGRNLGRFGFFEYAQPKHIGIGFKKSPVEGWFGV